MIGTRSVVLLAVVGLVGLTVAPVASGSFVNEVDDGGQPNERNESNANHSQGVATFIHANTADTENTLESELFERRYESADNESQKALVDDRTNGLAAKLESLTRERNELRDRRDELSTSEYRARMTRLTVEIAALERSIERTEPLALDTNTGVDRLETIRENAAALAGQQIAEIAKGLVGVDQSPGRGPFADHVGSERATGNAGGDTAKQAAPGNGESGNETRGSPNGASAERGQGQGQDRAQGQGRASNGNTPPGQHGETPADENGEPSTANNRDSAGESSTE